MRRAGRVLLLGLDAAEPRLIEEGIAAGWLPNLRVLRARGAYGRLASSARWLAGSPWPTFYTGTPPSEHGLYHWKQWRADKMTVTPCRPSWLPLQPFWRAWRSGDPRTVAIDVPMTYAPRPFHGLEISGWASHDQLMPPASHPRKLAARLEREHGPAPLRSEVYAPQPLGELLALRDELLRTTESVTGVIEALARDEAWDLCLAVFGATHRAGHKLWDHTGALGNPGPEEREALPRALREVYAACDAAVGRLLAAAGDEDVVLVFSLHGMGPNRSRALLMSALLERILEPRGESSDGDGRGDLLSDLRHGVPLGLRSFVKHRLPSGWQNRLTHFWQRRAIDWEATPALAPAADLQGYVRLNLRGREVRGSVEPGADSERLCAKLEGGLRSFVDADTGDPIVAEVARSAALYPAGPRRDALPDLIVRWSERPAAEHRAVVSRRYGEIPWPQPGRHPTGRSGNHRGEGFLLAAGPRVQPGSAIEGADIVDLAPSICALLGQSPPWPMSGRALDALCGR
jgi:predicted AlkP superfamily phosphohydrolase/phosphomutase